MELDLPKTIMSLVALGADKMRPVEKMDVKDRTYIVNQAKGEVTEVTPRFEDLSKRLPGTIQVRDITSLAAWADMCAVAAPGRGGLVILSAGDRPDSVVSAVFPAWAEPHEHHNGAVMPLFREYLPSGEWVRYIDFLAWVDKVHPFLFEPDAKVLDAALESVTGTEGASTTVKQSGAAISVQTSADKGAVVATRFPKEVRATIPFGDPSLRVPVIFTLALKVDRGDIWVRATAQKEPMTSEWIRLARDMMGLLPPGWRFVVGP